MRLARPLLPYLAVALVIAAGSTALVFATVGQGDAVAPSAGRSAQPAQLLSAFGRLAYWRQTPAGGFVLWASNFDGSSARPLLNLPPNTSRPFGTRWTADGRAVAYLTDSGIAVIGLDGSRVELTLPAAVRSAGFRIIDHRWSPAGTRVAATVFRSTDLRSEVHLASLDTREFLRVGELRLGDRASVFAADWLSEDEVMVESDNGILAAVSATREPTRRPGSPPRFLDAIPAASPFFDGSRVYYLVGPVAPNPDQTGIFVSNPVIKSALPEGADIRLEQRLGVAANLRLDGRWPDGRFLLHIFRDQTQYLASTSLTALAPPSLFRRVVVHPDGRSAVGLGGPRIVKIDLTRGYTPPDSAFVVLLDSVISADAWVRRAGLP